MRPRARPRLELLPLLDVFMVVLFAFAALEQERALVADEHHQDEWRLRQRERAEHAVAREQWEREQARLQEALRGAEKTLEAGRQTEVLEKLLELHAVVEVEIAGTLAPDGAVTNHCCFRTDPRAAYWHDCDRIPHRETDVVRWLAEAGNRLAVTLEGDPERSMLVIVRQDRVATFEAGRKLQVAIHDRFPSTVVGWSEREGTVRCSSPPSSRAEP